MFKGDKAYLDDIAKNYICSEHHTMVTVAWHAGENSYVLRCGQDHFPEEVTRQPSLTRQLLQGEELPELIKSNVEKGLRKRAVSQGRAESGDRSWLIPKADLATGEMLPPELIQALVDYAKHCGLDPYRGHVVLMYGKPYITLDGYIYHAHQVNHPYKLQSRPLTDEERVTYQVSEGSHAWLCLLQKVLSGSSFVGIGIVTKEEMLRESKKKPGQLASPVVAAHPWQLAQKRAEWQAFRRGFPIGETEEEKEE